MPLSYWTNFVTLFHPALSCIRGILFYGYFAGLPVAFLAFYVYEKKEQQIDAIVMDALTLGCKLKSEIVRKFVIPKSKKDR